MQATNYWQRHTQNENVESKISSYCDNVEIPPVDSGPNGAPVSSDWLILEQGDKEHCNYPRSEHGQRHICGTCKLGSRKNALVKEQGRDFDAPDREYDKELDGEQDLNKELACTF